MIHMKVFYVNDIINLEIQFLVMCLLIDNELVNEKKINKALCIQCV